MATCQKCRTDISEQAVKCPNCGFEPSAQGRRTRTAIIIVGAMFTGTGVGAVIGIPMILFGVYAGKKAKGRRPTAA